MGISGLLPLLKSIQKSTHLRQFAGQTLGVDAYGWLHRGTVACAIDLATGKPTTKYVDFAMHRVRMLVHFGVKPYLVFDGDYLPSKAGTESERAARRAEARRAGLELLRAGKASQAHLELQKAVDVTPEMARRLIEELKKAGVSYIVAPYEADSQLAYLEQKGLINGILSEDSDLLVFGARVLLTKLDQYGECIMVRRDDFTACREVSLVGWTDSDFRRMAILSGCDYIDNIPGLGLKTAHRLLRKYKTVERLVKALQFDGKSKVPSGYLAAFEQAERSFLHPWVFCPLERRLLNLTPAPPTVNPLTLPYIGLMINEQIAAKVASGDLHPHTKQPIVLPSAAPPRDKSSYGSENVSRTSSLKPSRSIEAFFKPTRRPLAELDPNCFTPSPGQQQLRGDRGNEGPWTASPTPAHQSRPYLDQRRALATPSTELPLSSRRTVSAPVAATAPHSHPAKRMRLCSDNGHALKSLSNAPPLETSKFFATPTSQTSFVARQQSSWKKNSDRDFTIYSDDSVGDVFAELDPSPYASAKRMPVDRAEERTASCAERGPGPGSQQHLQKPVDSQSTTVSRGTVSEESQGSMTTLTQATSIELLSQNDSTSARASTGRASPQRPRHTKLSPGLLEQQGCMNPPNLRDRRESCPSTNRKARALASSSLAVLDDPIGDNALQMPSESNKIGDGHRGQAQVAETIMVAGSPTGSTSQSEDRACLRGVGQTVASTGVAVQGSEDMLVPDSEGEPGTPSDDGCKGNDWGTVSLTPIKQAPGSKTLDLGRFIFAG